MTRGKHEHKDEIKEGEQEKEDKKRENSSRGREKMIGGGAKHDQVEETV